MISKQRTDYLKSEPSAKSLTVYVFVSQLSNLHNVSMNYTTVCNLLYSVSCHRRCQWCVCVLSSPWWSCL